MSSIISIPFQQKILLRSQFGSAVADDGALGWELRPHPFLAGPENYVICSAVYDVIQETPNPFLIIFCAPPGSGKTHLSEGLLLSWLAKRPNGRGSCVPAHEFAREWANAQRTRTPHEFFEKYQALEFIILEDIQDISTHPATQEQLVRLLDVWTRNQTRALLTSNQPFTALPFNEKLLSRLRQGVMIPIQLPSAEVRRGIITLPEHLQKAFLSEADLEEFVEQSERLKLSVGEMLQRFQKLVWSRKVDMEQRKVGVLPPQINRVPETESLETPQITIVQIAKLAAKFYKVRLADLRSKSRKTTLVTVRDVIYYMARQMTNVTLDEIGLYFNGRDHTTILHGCAQAEKLIRTDEEVKRCVDYLYSELRLFQKQARFRLQNGDDWTEPSERDSEIEEKKESETSFSAVKTASKKNVRRKNPRSETASRKRGTSTLIKTDVQNSENFSPGDAPSKKAGRKQTSPAKNRKKTV